MCYKESNVDSQADIYPPMSQSQFLAYDNYDKGDASFNFRSYIKPFSYAVYSHKPMKNILQFCLLEGGRGT